MSGHNDSAGFSQDTQTKVESPPIKSEKQLRKENKKLEKMEKFKAKQDKNALGKPLIKVPVQPEVEKSESKYEINYLSNGKKDIASFGLPDSYDPVYVEAGWYDWWNGQKIFQPKNGECCPFVMLMPPPNVTGTLHLGHALTCTIQDSLSRYHRMKGRPVLWVPGCDHAGIATQVVVEKWLWKTIKKSRHELGREAFVDKIWDWKREKGDRIYEQIKLMGASCDWSRAVYTMDERHSFAVREAFIRLFEKGEIYRDVRIVNWSTTLQSVISDIEVEKLAIKGETHLSVPGVKRKITFGIMIRFAYKLIDYPSEEIVVATTRLETMLGDVAVAVHPNDKRYKKYHGRLLKHPFFPQRRVVVVADDSVQIDFGTGAVKLSPGHDQMDFDIAKKFNLPIFSCMNDDGCMAKLEGSSSLGTKFVGMNRFDARTAIENELANLGLLRGEKEQIEMVLPICSRSKDVVEPMVKPQWFLKMSDDSRKAAELIENAHDIKVFPERYRAECIRILRQPRDWCLSRQLWWGHRIPAFQIDNKNWLCGHSEEDVRKRYNIKDNVSIVQDEDVLDTWFSSALLPFSAFGWPEKTEDLSKYFPGELLETGYDILFFWVMRMLIMSLKLLDGEIPFKNVYLHGLIRDSHGRKMSKSLGNIIDPIDVIKGANLQELNAQLLKYNLDEKEVQRALKVQKLDFPKGIPQCGTDALRFAFAAYSSQSTDINLDVLRVQGYRFFCNKIWNAFKFCIPFISSTGQQMKTIHFSEYKKQYCHPLDRWILSRLHDCVEAVNVGFLEYDFSKVSSSIYNFFLYEFCDLYIEYSKCILYDDKNCNKKHNELVCSLLHTCLDVSMRLMHPLMPYITEELYQRLPPHDSEKGSISIAPFPSVDDFRHYKNLNVELTTAFFNDCLQEIRSFRSMCEIPPKQNLSSVQVHIKGNQFSDIDLFVPVLKILAKCDHSSFCTLNNKIPEGYVPLIVHDGRIYVELKGMDVVKIQNRLETKIERVNVQLKKLLKEKSMVNYKETVPREVQDQNEQKLTSLHSEHEHLSSALQKLVIE